jgi:hypothetical protein
MKGSSRSARSRVASAMLHFAAVAVLVAMSVEMAPPVAAAILPVKSSQAPAVAAKVTPNSAPARKTKPRQAPTEVPLLRAAYSDTFDNHDGTFTASVSPSPINYKASGSSTYDAIDLTPSAISGGNGRLRAAKTPVPVEIGAPDDAAGFVSADTGKGKISLSLAPGAKAGVAGSKPSMPQTGRSPTAPATPTGPTRKAASRPSPARPSSTTPWVA